MDPKCTPILKKLKIYAESENFGVIKHWFWRLAIKIQILKELILWCVHKRKNTIYSKHIYEQVMNKLLLFSLWLCQTVCFVAVFFLNYDWRFAFHRNYSNLDLRLNVSAITYVKFSLKIDLSLKFNHYFSRLLNQRNGIK